MTKEKAKTIGWALTAAGIAYCAASIGSLIDAVGPMGRLAGDLGATLPWNTLMCLRIGDPMLAIWPVVLLLVPVLTMLRAKRPLWLILIPAVFCVLVMVYIVLARDGLMYPLRQMHEILGDSVKDLPPPR